MCQWTNQWMGVLWQEKHQLYTNVKYFLLPINYQLILFHSEQGTVTEHLSTHEKNEKKTEKWNCWSICVKMLQMTLPSTKGAPLLFATGNSPPSTLTSKLYNPKQRVGHEASSLLPPLKVLIIRYLFPFLLQKQWHYLTLIRGDNWFCPGSRTRSEHHYVNWRGKELGRGEEKVGGGGGL